METNTDARMMKTTTPKRIATIRRLRAGIGTRACATRNVTRSNLPGRSRWEDQAELAALAGLRLDREREPEALHHAVDEAQADAEPADPACLGRVRLREVTDELLGPLGIEARPGVAHHDLHVGT